MCKGRIWGLMWGVILTLALAASADHQPNHGKKAGGSGALIALQVTIDFDGSISTIGPFDALVECGSAFCEYNASAGSISGDIFYLPQSLAKIIEQTKWRDTQLNPENCYDIDNLNELKMVSLSNVFMRVYDDPSAGWFLAVDGTACDTDQNNCKRQYAQRFGGECDPQDGCPRIDNLGGGHQRQYGGRYLNTSSPPPDQKLGVPCRCTSSNTPACPDDVEEPIPPVTIIVERIP